MRRGLTLVELLVVVAILATLAGTILASQEGVEAHAHQDLVRNELVELREAVLRFRRDTGYLPKQGPYALASQGGEVTVPAGQTQADFEAWFASPGNLNQLYVNPLAGNANPRGWDPDLRRGWQGPYLGRSNRLVSLGDGLRADGALDPAGDEAHEGSRLVLVPGLADPFAKAPRASALGAVFAWTDTTGSLEREGRPLLLFSLDDPDAARAVSCGADGDYTPRAVSDLGPTAATSDDLGVFLLR
ncbi:MAG: prepilin-type N-terminal cleavage/methylation domain-containing protein [Planctomycetes bacterium]|nr:prepilin-type N-terminal cleavage/methylation domain-containing protein [Planctomycetota bacterium]